jgi:hypothetical protein
LPDVVQKDRDYLLNHCTKYLARDNADGRHSYYGADDGQSRADISEAWRFPIIDAHDGAESDAYDWNDVTFVYAGPVNGPQPTSVALLGTFGALYEPVPLALIGESRFWSCTLKVRKAERYRYRFLVDGAAMLDPVNPQTHQLSTGEEWSSFFTWSYNQPISFERWELELLDRITRHILPFNSNAAQNFMQRSANETSADHLYRLDISAGVANYIDKIVSREERHHRTAYKTCLEMIDRILRKRTQGRDPAFIGEGPFVRLYDELASNAQLLFDDGWDQRRYASPSYFLWLLRRHAWTGAFAHPKWGGNPGGMAWAYLAERFVGSNGQTAFNWPRTVEPPLGASTEYRG